VEVEILLTLGCTIDMPIASQRLTDFSTKMVTPVMEAQSQKIGLRLGLKRSVRLPLNREHVKTLH
jgi:hypothetical protein